MKHSYKLLIIFLIIYAGRLRAQDAHFSQFYQQPMLRNPALAGIFTGDIRFIGSYRNQWQSVTDPFRTYCLGSEFKTALPLFSDDDFLTIGLQLTNDVAGTSKFSKTQILPVLNFHKSVGDEKNSFLSAAIMGGWVQEKFDPTKLILNDQYTVNGNGSFTIQPASRQTFTNTSLTYGDLSAGISYSSSMGDDIDYYFGLGVFNITKPKLFYAGNEIKLNPKIAFNCGVSAPTSDANEFIFLGDYFQQGGHSTFQAGFLLGHDFFIEEGDRKGIRAGIFYRLNDAIIPVVELELSKFSIGASYDVNISKLVQASNYRGGVEITLSYKSFLNFLNSDVQAVKCPRFGAHVPSQKSYKGY